MMVSIHAPREGCDGRCDQAFCPLGCFNSRTPGGVRRVPQYTHLPYSCFNSRTPGGVRLHNCQPTDTASIVSIHAPREGCDRGISSWRPPAVCFNSRTPGGVRLTYANILRMSYMFQFTHPGRGATPDFSERASAIARFQFTHPGRGATSKDLHVHYRDNCFNSRTPGGVRQHLRGDSSNPQRFQFTHPGRGAT